MEYVLIFAFLLFVACIAAMGHLRLLGGADDNCTDDDQEGFARLERILTALESELRHERDGVGRTYGEKAQRAIINARSELYRHPVLLSRIKQGSTTNASQKA